MRQNNNEKPDVSKEAVAKRFEDVQFEFFEQDQDDMEKYRLDTLEGTVLIREDSMVLDIRDPEGASRYLIIGEWHPHHYRGTNTDCEASASVDAKWADCGGDYVGLWVEDGDRILFSFRLS